MRLRNKIAMTAPGTEVTLTLLRDGKEQQIKVKLGELRALARLEGSLRGGSARRRRKLGISVQPLTSGHRAPARIALQCCRACWCAMLLRAVPQQRRACSRGRDRGSESPAGSFHRRSATRALERRAGGAADESRGQDFLRNDPLLTPAGLREVRRLGSAAERIRIRSALRPTRIHHRIRNSGRLYLAPVRREGYCSACLRGASGRT